ncbi:FkbM family methyltransferase [Selenomonas sp. TAMA-11512]|uniref:FkbM family methyltransferase n=1 Tax=Selenomonas sp. TAMA-11512 TaxID=3095337 RepID=UPI0030CFE292
MNKIQEIFRTFRENRPNIEMPLAEAQANLGRFNNIVLYGAGSSGIAVLYFLRRIGIEPRFFLDSDLKKQGNFCEGVEILEPTTARERITGNVLVLVCINTDGKRYCKSFDEALRAGGHHAVHQKLADAGYDHVIDYTFFRHCFELFQNEQYNAPSCSDIDLMLAHEAEIEKTYDLLSDPLSKEVFEKILRFRLLDDTLSVPTMPQDNQYFEPEFYKPRFDAVFIDCGAFDGISARTFFRVNGDSFAGYYGLEPDAANFQRLSAYADTLAPNMREKMHIREAAAWKKKSPLKLYALQGPGSFVANDIGTDNVQGVRIDQLGAENVTFLKMNIEGSEKEALAGARAMICRDKPLLAIAGYHRTEDFWEIPLQIHAMREDYALHLRSYMNHISFVCYAD